MITLRLINVWFNVAAGRWSASLWSLPARFFWQDAHPKCHKTRTIWTAQLEILQNQIETLSIIVDAEKHGLSGHE